MLARLSHLTHECYTPAHTILLGFRVNCRWPFPAQSFLVPGPARLMTLESYNSHPSRMEYINTILILQSILLGNATQGLGPWGILRDSTSIRTRWTSYVACRENLRNVQYFSRRTWFGGKKLGNLDVEIWGVKIWTQDSVQCEAFVKTVRNFLVPQQVGSCWASWATISFSKTNHLHETG